MGISFSLGEVAKDALPRTPFPLPSLAPPAIRSWLIFQQRKPPKAKFDSTVTKGLNCQVGGLLMRRAVRAPIPPISTVLRKELFFLLAGPKGIADLRSRCW